MSFIIKAPENWKVEDRFRFEQESSWIIEFVDKIYEICSPSQSLIAELDYFTKQFYSDLRDIMDSKVNVGKEISTIEQSYLKQVLSLTSLLPIQKVYDVLHELHRPQNYYRINGRGGQSFFSCFQVVYFSEYTRMLDRLPGGRSFTSSSWSNSQPSSTIPLYKALNIINDGILEEIEYRKLIPDSYEYIVDIVSDINDKNIATISREMNAIGWRWTDDILGYGSGLYKEKATFYFLEEEDEIMMRIKYPFI